ncbi:ATP-binding protein [Sphingomonas sp. 35-24ZXX]|uniref:ATP-binding protein n=1 Tax=Sphingomonas sp. 35-24ZXX TaxID=1545915 RepID=UPI00068B3089|nr:ATP-binding protein [Sphingomonas sp. 35-24ZXX]
MIRRNFNPHSCSLDDNGPESIHRAVGLVQLFSTTNALSPQQRAKLAILAEEAVTNLYDHGAVQPGFGGTLALVGQAGEVRLILSDSGAPFDLREADVAEMPNVDRGGGVGLALIRAWADIIDYRSEDGINRLELKLRD